MAYKILKQFVPSPINNNQVWVAKLTPEDPAYIFNTLAEAEAKRDELDANDPTHRIYKIVEV